jgi:thymidylate kinase
MLIAIEGIDASGKATQARLLASKLGCDVQGFPDYTSPTGRLLEDLLQHREDVISDKVTPQQATLYRQVLFTINRHEKFDRLQAHHGHSAKHLVLDRYSASGFVYGQADGLSLSYLRSIHTALPPADLWILLNIPPEESEARRPVRRDEYERRVGFMHQVSRLYLDLFQVAPRDPIGGKWVVVDGMGEIEEVQARIFDEVEKIL